MANVTCQTCRAVITGSSSVGRPRRFCLECRPRKRIVESAPSAEGDDIRECEFCGGSFVTDTPRRYCSSKCRQANRKPTGTCVACKRPVHLSSTSAARPTCRDCRTWRHGTAYGYAKRGCRCVECRRAIAEDTRNRRHPGRKYHWISQADRFDIYERDEWICQLCGDLVDPEAPKLTSRYPTLDHIEPVSLALVPNHDPSNLRTAHNGCNAARGNRK